MFRTCQNKKGARNRLPWVLPVGRVDGPWFPVPVDCSCGIATGSHRRAVLSGHLGVLPDRPVSRLTTFLKGFFKKGNWFLSHYFHRLLRNLRVHSICTVVTAGTQQQSKKHYNTNHMSLPSSSHNRSPQRKCQEPLLFLARICTSARLADSTTRTLESSSRPRSAAITLSR